MLNDSLVLYCEYELTIDFQIGMEIRMLLHDKNIDLY